jgi:hypothetical protein
MKYRHLSLGYLINVLNLLHFGYEEVLITQENYPHSSPLSGIFHNVLEPQMANKQYYKKQ